MINGHVGPSNGEAVSGEENGYVNHTAPSTSNGPMANGYAQ